MKLICRNKQQAFGSLKCLKDVGQLAYLYKSRELNSVPVIRICHETNFYGLAEEIISFEQLVENEYKIIA